MEGLPGPSKIKFDPVPEFSSGVWHGKERNISEKKPNLNELVSGNNRCKYFTRSLQTVNPQQQQQIEVQLFNVPAWLKTCIKSQPSEMVCMSTQTDYRESEAQTDPWDAPHTTTGSPEILALAALKYGEELPITDEYDLEKLQRAREKRILEASLPSLHGTEIEKLKRHKMVIGQKLKEMDYTISEIKEMQQEKLVILQTCLMNTLKQREERKEQLLDSLWEQKKDDLQYKISKLHDRYSQSIEILSKKRAILNRQYDELANIEYEAGNKTVSDSALVTTYQNKKYKGPPVDNYYLSDAQGIVELERWMWEEQKILMEPEMYLPKKEAQPTRLQKIIAQTEKMMSAMKAEKTTVAEEEKVFAAERTRARPPTPTAIAIPLDVLNCNYSAVLFEKAIRGRAIQKEVLETRNNYSDFIETLRKSQFITNEERLKIQERKKQSHLLYLEEKVAKDEVRALAEVVARFEGEAISRMLNMLGKTVSRYQKLKEVLEIVCVAKDQRRRREAEEAGRRQQEAIQRQILSKVPSAQATVVNAFIEDVITARS